MFLNLTEFERRVGHLGQDPVAIDWEGPEVMRWNSAWRNWESSAFDILAVVYYSAV